MYQTAELFPLTEITPQLAWRSTLQRRWVSEHLATAFCAQQSTALQLYDNHGWRITNAGISVSSCSIHKAHTIFRLENLPLSAALTMLSTSVGACGHGYASFKSGQRNFVLATAEPVQLATKPIKSFPKLEMDWIRYALKRADFVLVREGQISVATPAISVLSGNGLHPDKYAIVGASVFSRAMKLGPFESYSFTPEKLWMHGNSIEVEIDAERKDAAFDPSPLINESLRYPVRVFVSAGSRKVLRNKVTYAICSLRPKEDGLELDLGPERVRLKTDAVVGVQQGKNWRVQARPLLAALSQRGKLVLHLPERPLAPVAIQCADRWMWLENRTQERKLS